MEVLPSQVGPGMTATPWGPPHCQAATETVQFNIFTSWHRFWPIRISSLTYICYTFKPCSRICITAYIFVLHMRVYPKVSGLVAWEWELQMVQLSATKCSCIAILWVSLVSFAAITPCVASQWVIPKVSVYFVIDSVWKLLNTPLNNEPPIIKAGKGKKKHE
jgi:hypothetical protein